MSDRRRDAGFTLVEVLVAAAIMGLVMIAIVGIYQVAQRATLFATAGEEAQSNVRATLDRIAADFRRINAARADTPGAVTAASATSITFLGDIDNDTLPGGVDTTLSAGASAGATSITVTSTAGFSVGEQIFIADGPIVENQTITNIAGSTLTLGAALSTWYPATAIVRSVETVTWAWDSATRTLCRNVGAGCTAPYATDLVIANGITSFQLTYLDKTRATIGNLGTQANRDSIKEIRIQIGGQTQTGDQTVTRNMEMTVKPRNL